MGFRLFAQHCFSQNMLSKLTCKITFLITNKNLSGNTIVKTACEPIIK